MKAMEKALSKCLQAVVGLMGRGALHPFSWRWRKPLDAWLRMLRFLSLKQERVMEQTEATEGKAGGNELLCM